MDNDFFRPCDILLPTTEIDMSKWAVIACDQHTSEPDYWERVREYAEGSPSAYNMMLPEHYYRSPRIGNLISDTREAMDDYLNGGVFRVISDSYIIVERTLYNDKTRFGIVGAIDLECYDPAQLPDTSIRATEEVVPERLPLRIRLREAASIDMPHILMMTDTRFTFTERELSRLEVLYDFDLMEGGGHIKGRRANSDFPIPRSDLLLVGDGNHSVASAKACWEKLKPTLSEAERETHPCRFLLVEVVSIHDPSLEFEPINRIVFDCDPEKLVAALREKFHYGDEIVYAYGNHNGLLHVPSLSVLQAFLDEYPERGHIDYIHGEDVAAKLARKPETLAIILPAIDKDGFFDTVRKGGAFPRKAFSMGGARDKRYYLECRKLIADD
ncbi:MAG: DUF1015 domain-containing protein [Oscillospiraceae bacterium]|jgi:hypothetical protein|nr:DUF1015 domain-containing protein [Oscillospiraceae bacterium]